MRIVKTSLALLCCCFAVSSSVVLADVVPPPPSKCPRGQIGITSHHGPECVEPAPKSCPPGWRGQIRGLCVVESCATDAECGVGKQCKTADVCLHEYLREWGYEERPSPRVVDPSLLAAPPQHFDPPQKVVEAVGVCGGDRTCPADSTCNKGKVCLPTGVAKPGDWRPTNKPKK